MIAERPQYCRESETRNHEVSVVLSPSLLVKTSDDAREIAGPSASIDPASLICPDGKFSYIP